MWRVSKLTFFKFEVSVGVIAIIASLTAFYLNSEHILFETNTQLWETGG